MFIPLKMVCIGIDPYPFHHVSPQMGRRTKLSINGTRWRLSFQKKTRLSFSGHWGHFQAQVGGGWHCPTGLFWLGCSEWTTTRINWSLLNLVGVSWVCMLASFETPGIGFGQVTRSKVSTWEQIHRDLPQKCPRSTTGSLEVSLIDGCPNPKNETISVLKAMILGSPI